MSTKFFIPRMHWAKNETQATSYTDQAVVAFDNNPDTSEVALTSGSGARSIRIDMDAMESATSIDWSIDFVGLVTRNYTSSWAGYYVTVYSGTDSTYATLTARTAALNMSLASSNNFILSEITAQTDRYWAILSDLVTPGIEVAMAMLGTVYSVSVRWNYESQQTADEFNNNTELLGGRVLSHNIRSSGGGTFIRVYELISTTDKDAILSAHAAARGRHTPFVYVDDGADVNQYGVLARFASDTIQYTQVVSGLWNVYVPLQHIARIPDGRPY